MVKVWDALNGHRISSFKGYGVVSPDGQQIAGIEGEGLTVIVWDNRNWKGNPDPKGPQKLYPRSSLRPTQEVISGSLETVKVWDARSGQESGPLRHSTGVASLAFSPDGKQIASGDYEGAVKVWDASMARKPGALQDTQGL